MALRETKPGRAPRRRRAPRAGRVEGVFELMGRVAEALCPDDLPASLDATLEILRRAFGADACEIFLGGPGGEVVLVSARGRDGPLLSSRPRFAKGLGHPGIVAKTARPLSTRALDKDPRYLRKNVPAHGLRASVAVPLLGSGEVLGTLHVYWRRPKLALDSVQRAAEQLARPISTALRAGLARFRERVDSLAGSEPGAKDAQIDALLQEIRRVSSARATALVCLDGQGGSARIFGDHRLTCAELGSPGACPCPVVQEGLSGPEALAQVKCPALQDQAGRPGCIPLSAGGAVRGVLRLEYGREAPLPPTRNLVPLLAMGGALAARLDHWARVAAPPSAASSAIPGLALRCFGPLEIRRDGKRVPRGAFARSKALVLLKLLLVREGHPIRREALIEQLWPEVGERAGANRLHGVVHALRVALEPRSEERQWRYVCNEGDQYYFNVASPQQVDLFAFREATDRGLRAFRQGQGDEARRAFEAALGSGSGELFEDDPDPERFAAERVRLRDRRLETLGKLASILRAQGEVEAALERLRQGLAIDPLREDLHQEAIRALVELGRRADALAQYRECERLLREELGAQPLAETRALGVLLKEP